MSHRSFRQRNALAQHDLHYGPNMTPMVDVVMVILVFFMASAVFLGPEWFLRTAIPVVKAGVAAPAPVEKKTLRIALDRDGDDSRASVNGAATMTLAELQSMLEAQVKEHTAANLTIVVNPAPDAPYEGVVLVHEYCQRLGITRIGILEEPGSSGEPRP